MPSKGSPASTSDIPEWRQRLKADLGEDPGRFLDRDLLARPRRWHVVEDDHGGKRMEARPDTDCSTAAAFVKARIRGIDRLDRISAWKAVERRLDRGPRPKVIQLLEEREQVLEEIGERPDRLAEQDRRDPEPTASNVVWPDRDGNERSATYSSGRYFGGPDADGESDAASGEAVATDGGADE